MDRKSAQHDGTKVPETVKEMSYSVPGLATLLGWKGFLNCRLSQDGPPDSMDSENCHSG